MLWRKYYWQLCNYLLLELVLSGDVDARNTVIKELSEWQDIGTLLQDPFANYVVQTALSHAGIIIFFV